MVDLAFGATAMASIFAIVDPLGVVPFFSVLTEDMTPVQKQQIVSKACLTATITLGMFAIFGQWIFAAFGFTIPAFKIAGGALLFVTAFQMTQGQRTSRRAITEGGRDEETESIGVVPLGIPLLAGPGAITTVMIYMTRPDTDPFDKTFIFIGILIAVLLTFFLLRSASVIYRRVGKMGTIAFGRIMGLLLAAVGVQFVIDGILQVARSSLLLP